ncbi:type II toxin-antitoxin system VapC family toxin [Candidatus Bathyarchaeota archaeon]|nr:type II toxin-antitoxin system VapC family toxin [Candidatus Bathyarchaeota archaeon]MBS7629917.1 type II toxin-antitoxin system VapC family toxin [Candidatus Bathyarchaeota archaeon]
MYLVDTNIFLEVLLSRSKKDECERFLNYLKEGKKLGVITDFSIHSILVIMEGLGRRRELKIFLRGLSAYRGLTVYTTTLADEINAVEISYENNLDLDDAIQYVVALTLEVHGIISFDKHFDRLRIPRIDPSAIM